MSKVLLLVILIVAVAGIIYFLNIEETQAPPAPQPPAQIQTQEPPIIIGTMTISSPAFTRRPTKEGEELFIPRKYTCDGDDINPPLQISGVPANAKSLVLIVDDPDAPAGTWVHWIVWNIDSKTTAISENGLPKGVNLEDATLGPQEGTTDFGRPGWGGPCPPSGTHRYFFKIYALDEAIPDLDSKARKADLEAAMQGHILDQAELIGLYKRS